MGSVRIFQKIENNMQWGRANGKGWILRHDVPYACRADPLTGWQGSGDVRGQVELRFPTLDAAVAYAEREGLDYHVVPTGKRSPKIRSYADNSTTGPALQPAGGE